MRPGKQMTDQNIEQILAVNSDKMNVEMVKVLVKHLNLSKCNITDSKLRSRALCDVQNVCNIIVHLQNRMTANECKYHGDWIVMHVYISR